MEGTHRAQGKRRAEKDFFFLKKKLPRYEPEDNGGGGCMEMMKMGSELSREAPGKVALAGKAAASSSHCPLRIPALVARSSTGGSSCVLVVVVLLRSLDVLVGR